MGNKNEYLKLQAEKEARKLQETEKLEALKKEEEKLTKEHERLMEDEVGDTNTTNVDMSGTKTGGVSLDPFKPILFPIQKILKTVVDLVRIVRNVVTWEEPFLAF